MRRLPEDATKTEFTVITHVNPGGVADTHFGSILTNRLSTDRCIHTNTDTHKLRHTHTHTHTKSSPTASHELPAFSRTTCILTNPPPNRQPATISGKAQRGGLPVTNWQIRQNSRKIRTVSITNGRPYNGRSRRRRRCLRRCHCGKRRH